MSTGAPMGGGVITGRDGVGNPIVTYYSSGPTAPAGGWFNVWDYWQDTDAWPVLDHTPMIRRALDACRLSGQGGTVYCPAYRYQLASTYPCPTAPASIYAAALHIGANTRLLGDGEGATVFVLGPNAPDQSSAIMNYDPTAGGDTNISFEHFTLDGNAANQAAPNLDAINGIVSWKVRGWRVRHVTVHDCYGTTGGGNGPFGTGGESAGINPQACTDVVIEDCTVWATSAQTATGMGINSCSNVRLSDCTVYGMGLGQGISVYYCAGVRASNCQAYLNGGHGLNTEYSTDVCWDSCTGGGVSASTSSYPYANSTNLGNTKVGFNMIGTNSDVRFVNCAAYNNGPAASTIDGFYFVGTNIRATNCSAVGNAKYGFGDGTNGSGALVLINCTGSGNGTHLFSGNGVNTGASGWEPQQNVGFVFPTSGVDWVNNFSVPLMIYLQPSGGSATMTSVKVNGAAIGGGFNGTAGTNNFGFPIRLLPGAKVNFTYTGGPPAWTLFTDC